MSSKMTKNNRTSSSYIENFDYVVKKQQQKFISTVRLTDNHSGGGV